MSNSQPAYERGQKDEGNRFVSSFAAMRINPIVPFI